VGPSSSSPLHNKGNPWCQDSAADTRSEHRFEVSCLHSNNPRMLDALPSQARYRVIYGKLGNRSRYYLQNFVRYLRLEKLRQRKRVLPELAEHNLGEMEVIIDKFKRKPLVTLASFSCTDCNTCREDGPDCAYNPSTFSSRLHCCPQSPPQQPSKLPDLPISSILIRRNLKSSISLSRFLANHVLAFHNGQLASVRKSPTSLRPGRRVLRE
jgi:hypothetical protein